MRTNKMTMKMIGGLLLLALSSLTAPAQAFSVSNGSFEAGGFTGWDTLSSGNETVVDNTAVCGSAMPCSGSPTDGSFAALLETPGTANVSNLETFLGLTSGSLVARNVAGGSAMSQTFTLDTAGTLSFNWNFLTDETVRTPAPNDDFASYFLSFTETPLGSALSNNLVSSGTRSFDTDIGFNSVSLPLSAGTYTLKFLVADSSDTTVQSGLLVDNVSFQPAPEPTTMSWFGSTLALVMSAQVRRRKLAAQAQKSK
jgi:hypothetical protein